MSEGDAAPGTRTDRAERARVLAATARSADGSRALEAWAAVRRLLGPRPRIPGLAEIHLDAHALPLAVAGAAPLRPGTAERIYEDGVALARELSRGPRAAEIEHAFATWQVLRGAFEAARVHATRAVDVFDRYGDPCGAARAAATREAARLGCGEPPQPGPLETRRAALEADARGESRAARAVLLRRLAWDAALRGDLEAAVARATAAADGCGDDPARARTRAELAWLLVRADRPERGRDQARGALDAVPRPDAEGARTAALGVLALAELACGAPAAARGAALEAVSRAEASGVREDGWLPLPWIAAECLAACGEADAARARLAEAARVPRLRETAAQRLHEARTLARLGERDAARAALERAAALRERDPLGRVPWPADAAR